MTTKNTIIALNENQKENNRNSLITGAGGQVRKQSIKDDNRQSIKNDNRQSIITDNRKTIKNDSTKNKIPLPPSQNSSMNNLSIRVKSESNFSTNSISARSVRSRNSNSSFNSKTQLSTSSPKFLNWALQNVSSRLLPSDYEIEDYDHSVRLNRQRSMSGSVSTLNNDSDASNAEQSNNNQPLNSNSNRKSVKKDIDTNRKIIKDSAKNELLTMDTIQSPFITNIEGRQLISPSRNSNFPRTESLGVISPKKKALADPRSGKKKPPLPRHRSTKSHSADFALSPDYADFMLTPSPELNYDDTNLRSKTNDNASSGNGATNTDYDDIIQSVNSSPVHTSPFVVQRSDSSIASEESFLGDQTMEPNSHELKNYGATNGMDYYDLGVAIPQPGYVNNQKKYAPYNDDESDKEMYMDDKNVKTNKWESERISLLNHQSTGDDLKRPRRSFRRRIFLLLTEPQTSILSAIIFAVYFIMLLCSVIIMMIQTMRHFQYTPDQCEYCMYGGLATDDNFGEMDASFSNSSASPPYNSECECPPIPIPIMITLEDWIIYFFSVEWILRVVSFSPLKTVDGNQQSFFE